MLGILFSLFPMLGWGASDYASSLLSKKHHPASVNLAFFLVTGIPIVIFCSFFGLPEVSAGILASFLAVEVILTLGFMTMVKAFSTGATGVVAPIANAYAVVTLILAVVFLDASISWMQVLAIFAVVSGIGFLSYTKKTTSAAGRQKGVLLALLAMLLFGFGFIGFDLVSTQEWYQNTILFQLVGTTLAIVIYMVQVRKNRVDTIVSLCKNKITIAGGVAAGVGTVGMFLAIENTSNITIPATIAAASPLVTALLARKLEHEKLSLHQYAGMIMVVGGIVMLSAVGSN